LEKIGAIERRRMNINQYLIRAKGRVGSFTPNQGPICLLSINVDGFHRISFPLQEIARLLS